MLTGVIQHKLSEVKRQLLSFQLLIVDGQELRHNPASVMDNIQKFLGVTPLFNYTQALR